LEDLTLSPHIAVVLGIFADHLDRYGDLAAYTAAKSAIARYQTRHDLVLYNFDCERATSIASLSVGRRLAFGKDRPSLLSDGPGPLLGDFNNYNVWPAIHIGRHFRMSDDDLARAIRSFSALPGRLETVVDKEGIRFICDIRSTAPEVTVAALQAVAQNGDSVHFLLLGGVDRNQDYRSLLPALARSAVQHILLFPPTGMRIGELLRSSNLSSRVKLFEPQSMEDAIRYVYRNAPAGQSVCLMSTGAPSSGGFFHGPEDKAHQFAHFARTLGRSEART
jgi:UDP-N-acetylmuramoylalanine-D-glutamate ligase